MLPLENVAKLILLATGLLLLLATEAGASAGDNSQYYQNCEEKCLWANCTDDESDFLGEKELPLSLQVMQWSCGDECRYMCMWKTVDAFVRRDWPVPQFHGKWPFVRILGIQEPASVLFSLLNFYVHLKMIKKLRAEVRSDSPLYWLWHLYSAVCLNAWIWSMIFHARDFPFTEFMDYSCAFSIVLISFYCMSIRLLRNLRRSLLIIFSAFVLSFYANHVAYLKMGQFDYSYNMQVNLLVGSFTAITWFTWCMWNRFRQPYVWKCALYVAMTSVVTLLEILDRPPVFWLFDSHSLWHLGTAPSFYVFYSFVIDDCKYLRKQKLLTEEAASKNE